jgi:hypothetical protein
VRRPLISPVIQLMAFTPLSPMSRPAFSSHAFAVVERRGCRATRAGSLSCDLGERSRSRPARTPCQEAKQGEWGVALRHSKTFGHTFCSPLGELLKSRLESTVEGIGKGQPNTTLPVRFTGLKTSCGTRRFRPPEERLPYSNFSGNRPQEGVAMGFSITSQGRFPYPSTGNRQNNLGEHRQRHSIAPCVVAFQETP